MKDYNAEAVARMLGKPLKTKNGWMTLCPAHDDNDPSLSVRDKPHGGILVNCFAGCPYKKVSAELKQRGIDITATPQRIGAPSGRVCASNRNQIRANNPLLNESLTARNNLQSPDFWPNSSEEVKNFLAENPYQKLIRDSQPLFTEEPNPALTYLTRRLGGRSVTQGYELPGLLFHRSVFHSETKFDYPALLGVVTDLDQIPVGVHRTYLTPDGEKAQVACTKKALGKISGGAVKFAQPTTVLAVAEGIETALAVRFATSMPTWSAISATGVGQLLVPDSVNTIHIFADKDRNGTGVRAAERLAERMSELGKEVYIHIPPGAVDETTKSVDWLDILLREGEPAFTRALRETPLYAGPSKPRFVLKITQESQLLDEVWVALTKANIGLHPTIYRTGESLVLVVGDRGNRRAVLMTIEQLRIYLVRFADWYAAVKRKDESGLFDLKPTSVPKDFVSLIYHAPRELMELVGISKIPILSGNGSFILKNGYDCETKLYFDVDDVYKNLIDCPAASRPSLAESRSLICDELLSDFPFQSEAHKANYISALILPFIRPFFDLAPLFIIDANCPGSGKTRLVEIFSRIIYGKSAEAVGLSRDEAEQRKIITTLFSEGRNEIIFFDNVPSGILGSSQLAIVATQLYWSDRLLGKNSSIRIPNRSTWFITGNLLRPTQELMRRTPLIRLKATTSNPAKRCRNTFRHPDIIQWVKENRAALVAAIITLVQNWVENGMERKYPEPTLGSFEEWSAITAAILDLAGIRGFLQNHNSDSDDSAKPSTDLSALLRAWWQAYQAQTVSVGDLVANPEIRKLCSELIGCAENKMLLGALGQLLVDNSCRSFENLKVKFKKGGKANLYHLEQLHKGEEGVQPFLLREIFNEKKNQS